MARRKLLRKDVLKWIRNLESGEYRKTECRLVNETGTTFCCLGVWADQHGCTWKVNELEAFGTPVAPGKDVPTKDQMNTYLNPPVAFGLSRSHQTQLAILNDQSVEWDTVIDYIKKKILPKAK